jgi:hypothetical protein
MVAIKHLGKFQSIGRAKMRFRGSRRESRMLFMVIERFKDDDMVPIYRRLRDAGRG